MNAVARQRREVGPRLGDLRVREGDPRGRGEGQGVEPGEPRDNRASRAKVGSVSAIACAEMGKDAPRHIRKRFSARSRSKNA